MVKGDGVRLVDAVELGGALGVSGSTIRRWARQGTIPAIRVTARTLRFSTEAVLQAVQRLPVRPAMRETEVEA